MRFLFNIFISLVTAISLSAQTCPLNNWIENNYLFDAKILTLREILADDQHPWKDSINLPDSTVNAYLGLISTVFELNTAASDSVFDIYQIHVFPEMSYNMLRMEIDTNYSWIREYLNDSLISGNPVFDSLTSLYNFSLLQYGYYSVTSSSLSLITDKVLNIANLVSAFEPLEGIGEVIPEQWVGDGADIRINFSGDTANLDFSYGWMDCPAGCVFRYHWNFRVLHCDAEFSGSYGNPYSQVNSREQEEQILFPNPVRDKLYLSNPDDELLRISIIMLNGQTVLNTVTFSGEIDLHALSSGMYLLTIQSENKRTTYPLIKQ